MSESELDTETRAIDGEIWIVAVNSDGEVVTKITKIGEV